MRDVPALGVFIGGHSNIAIVTVQWSETMSVERKYKCNFCGGLICSEQPGYGLEWEGPSLEEVALSTADDHLCRGCMIAIHARADVILRRENNAEWGG